MGKKKIRITAPSPQSRSILKPVIGALLIGGLVWGLASLFEPPPDLVPYTKYKKTDVSAVEPANKPIPSTPPKSAAPAEPTAPDDPMAQAADPDKNALNSMKEVADTPLAPTPPDLPTHLPRETLEHISKAMGLVEQGKYERAELEFEKAADFSPNSPEVFSIWGVAMRMQKKFKGANRRFARAYELAPEDEEIVFNWGMTRLFEKNADQAIDLFQKTLKLNPKHYMAHNYLGKSYGLKKNLAMEETHYAKALEIKEDFAQAHFNLGIVRSLQKNFEGAAPHFQRAIELDKQFEKPFVIQFLTAMDLKKKGVGPQEAKLKPSPKKGDNKDSPKETEEAAKKSEGSDHKMEGSDSKVTKPVTNVKGRITINSQPVDGRGIVILETKSKLKAPEQEAQPLTVFQRDLRFEPSHSVVMIGSTVTFVNDDREIHNIYSKSLGNQFNLGAMSAGASRQIKLETPGPVILRCNLHKDMMGTVFVVPNGYYAQTNANGEYQFDNVKSQEYILEFWHPQLYPEDVEKNIQSIKLTGKDENIDFKIASASKPGEIHDLVDATDYNLVVDSIAKEMFQAIEDWDKGKKFIPRNRMLKAITHYYDGQGLKGALAKSFSDTRSQKLEQSMDEIRKQISGIGVTEPVTEASLKFKAERIVVQLRNHVKELEHRLNPKP
ncbi:MAG: tetratricopeptide repeat protein [Nitrospinae bacterium]|nr:tetratricopeptide repeat protein [Nitrospinota bacterium]